MSWIEEKVREGRGEKRDRGELETYHCQKDKLTPTQNVICRQSYWDTLGMEKFDLLSNEIITDIGKKFNNLNELRVYFTSLDLS